MWSNDDCWARTSTEFPREESGGGSGPHERHLVPVAEPGRSSLQSCIVWLITTDLSRRVQSLCGKFSPGENATTKFITNTETVDGLLVTDTRSREQEPPLQLRLSGESNGSARTGRSVVRPRLETRITPVQASRPRRAVPRPSPVSPAAVRGSSQLLEGLSHAANSRPVPLAGWPGWRRPDAATASGVRSTRTDPERATPRTEAVT
jgi:hypothetical protein